VIRVENRGVQEELHLILSDLWLSSEREVNGSVIETCFKDSIIFHEHVVDVDSWSFIKVLVDAPNDGVDDNVFEHPDDHLCDISDKATAQNDISLFGVKVKSKFLDVNLRNKFAFVLDSHEFDNS